LEAGMTVKTDFIKITPRAIEEVKKLIQEDGKPGIGLRLGVKGGGCSGLSYDLQFTPQEAGDTVIDNDGVQVFMDAKSMIYLKGMQLDFHGGLQGKGFVFSNPNATSTCGCGESFSVS
jgi:iron-sulfur cluster assembly protein